MPSSQDIFDDLNSSGLALHGIIRPHPESSDHILFSTHENAGDAVPIPVDQIKGVTKNGDLRGLSPDCHSVDIVLNKSIENLSPTYTDLLKIANKSLIEKTNPVYCYDEKGNWVPCP